MCCVNECNQLEWELINYTVVGLGNNYFNNTAWTQYYDVQYWVPQLFWKYRNIVCALKHFYINYKRKAE